jgi:hypothetical protein
MIICSSCWEHILTFVLYRKIDSVTVFQGKEHANPNMIFFVK